MAFKFVFWEKSQVSEFLFTFRVFYLTVNKKLFSSILYKILDNLFVRFHKVETKPILWHVKIWYFCLFLYASKYLYFVFLIFHQELSDSSTFFFSWLKKITLLFFTLFILKSLGKTKCVSIDVQQKRILSKFWSISKFGLWKTGENCA